MTTKTAGGLTMGLWRPFIPLFCLAADTAAPAQVFTVLPNNMRIDDGDTYTYSIAAMSAASPPASGVTLTTTGLTLGSAVPTPAPATFAVVGCDATLGADGLPQAPPASNCPRAVITFVAPIFLSTGALVFSKAMPAGSTILISKATASAPSNAIGPFIALEGLSLFAGASLTVAEGAFVRTGASPSPTLDRPIIAATGQLLYLEGGANLSFTNNQFTAPNVFISNTDLFDPTAERFVNFDHQMPTAISIAVDTVEVVGGATVRVTDNAMNFGRASAGLVDVRFQKHMRLAGTGVDMASKGARGGLDFSRNSHTYAASSFGLRIQPIKSGVIGVPPPPLLLDDGAELLVEANKATHAFTPTAADSTPPPSGPFAYTYTLLLVMRSTDKSSAKEYSNTLAVTRGAAVTLAANICSLPPRPCARL